MNERRLDAIADLARAAGAEAIVEESRALAGRLAEGRFCVACVGQFKRGKSTLLNALVGAEILPTGVLPVTAVVTVLRHGAAPSVRVQLAGGWRTIAADTLADWVAEARNPGNQKGVVAVEVFVPSPLLATGMCLVDTPGIGSVFAANSEATRAFVPHVDAALVVLGADPPISAEELALVEAVGRQVGELVFVMNKADRIAFYFNDLLSVGDPGLGRAVLDRIAPRRAGIERDARRYLARLLETNSARVVNDLRDRVLESRRRLEAEIRARLRELVASAERALERARALQAAGAETTAAARAYLDSLEQRAAAL